MQNLGVIEDGALLVVDGIIREVGPSRRLENLAAARHAAVINASGRAVMPGFVDSHTHLISGPPHFGEADDEIPAIRAVRSMSARRMREESEVVARSALAHGVTTLEAKSGYGLNESGELKILRALMALGDLPMEVIPTFFAARTVPWDFGAGPVEYMDWLRTSLLPRVHQRGLARFVDVACEPGGFPAKLAAPYLETARAMGLGVKAHCGQYGPVTGLSQLLDAGAISIDHLDYAQSDDIIGLAGSNAIATLTPAASFYAATGRYAPAREMLERGCAVALATNFDRFQSPTYNMQMVVFLACRRLGMNIEEAISAATINGAHALALGHRVGSLEYGKQADLLLLNVPDYRELACDFGVNLVGATMKRGEIVYNTTEVRWDDD